MSSFLSHGSSSTDVKLANKSHSSAKHNSSEGNDLKTMSTDEVRIIISFLHNMLSSSGWTLLPPSPSLSSFPLPPSFLPPSLPSPLPPSLPLALPSPPPFPSPSLPPSFSVRVTNARPYQAEETRAPGAQHRGSHCAHRHQDLPTQMRGDRNVAYTGRRRPPHFPNTWPNSCSFAH